MAEVWIRFYGSYGKSMDNIVWKQQQEVNGTECFLEKIAPELILQEKMRVDQMKGAGK